MKKDFYILSLGSNIDNRKENLELAIHYISEFTEIKNISSIYETEPYGIADQKEFYNIALSGFSEDDAITYMNKLLKIEEHMGRKRQLKNGPRIIDLDIIAVDDLEINIHNLTVPHPKFQERNFVLIPIHEIEPNYIIRGKSISHYLKECNDLLLVKKVEENLNVDSL